jgi:general secretion pathway protein A
MYEAYFGLMEKPFSLVPDSQFLYLSRSHAMAMSLLEYGLTEQTGFVVISGEVGSGKTTLVRRLLATVGQDLTIGLISNTHSSLGDLLKWILLAFDLDTAGKDAVNQYRALLDFLIEQYAAGKRTALIVDEAQNLGVEALEELRMLSNVNADKHFLLQLIIVGQPELRETLRRPDLRQFVQRISLHCHLDPLELAETMSYIRHRLQTAGGEPELFDDAACAAVHHYASGIPRLINVICDLALVYAYAEDRPSVDADTVLDVVIARQAKGLGAFRECPEGASRNDMRTMFMRMANAV